MKTKNYFTTEIPVKTPDFSDKITFIVASDGCILFIREYTRHRMVLKYSEYDFNQIEWGGIMSQRGEWIRRSFDFGDAPNSLIRNTVLQKIRDAL